MLDKYRLLGFSQFCEPSFIIHLVILVPIKSWKRLASSNDNFGLIRFVALFTVECPQVDCPSYCPHGRHYGALANGCPTCECCEYGSNVITIYVLHNTYLFMTIYPGILQIISVEHLSRIIS